MLAVILVLVALLQVGGIRCAEADNQTIYIRADGSIDPPTAPMLQNGDLYTLTSDIVITLAYDGIVIERGNLTLDGVGFTIDGPYIPESDFSAGIRVVDGAENVTIQNVRIKEFAYGIALQHIGSTVCRTCLSRNKLSGIFVFESSSNTIFANNMTQNGEGIDLYRSSNNIVFENNVAGSMWRGIYTEESNHNRFYSNNFLNNPYHVYDRSMLNPYYIRSVNVWDDGYARGGNYWGDYNGTDLNHDGIGDTPYKLDYYNIDHRPLMEPVLLVPPTPLSVIGATFKVYPCPMNLKCKSKWITAYVEPPPRYEVANINISSLRLNKAVPAEMQYTQIGDYDNDNCPDLMVAFNKTTFLTHLFSGWNFYGSVTVTLAVTGSLFNKTLFAGEDTITISQVAGDVNCDGRVDMYDIILASVAYGAEENQQIWDVNADLAAPLGIINILDLLTAAANYGDTD